MPVPSRVLTIALAVAALAALVPAAGAAAPAQNRTKVTIEFDGSGAFEGKVVSPTPSCERGRKVTLYRKKGTGPAKAVDSDRSGADGSWSIEASVGGPGTYYAMVGAKPGAETLTACRAGRSERVIFD